jgi:Flp pilus assembly protein TadB
VRELVLAPGLAGSAAAIAVVAFALRSDAVVARAVGGASERSRSSGRLRRWLGTHLCRRPFVRPDRLSELIRAAGSTRSVVEVAGQKWLVAGVTGTSALLLPAPMPILAPLLAMGAFVAPDLALRRAAGHRRARADRELPLLLDLLAVGSAAGLSPPLSLRAAVEATEGPLADELGEAVRRMDLGGRWSDELPAAADRFNLSDLRRAMAILVRSGSLGSSLSDALSQLADECRASRRAVVAERARKAPVKMLFPLVFLVLPAFLLLTVVPVLVTTLQSIS